MLRVIIREEDQNTRVTLLEYLKRLSHPIEWENLVKDTKILAEESARLEFNGVNPFAHNEKGDTGIRTRIWVSLRAQTLYRIVPGMMNYSKAIKLLYRVENTEVVQKLG